MLFGPLLGVVAGLVTADLLMPHDSGEIASYAAAANGFLVFLCMADGVAFSIPISVPLAIWSWRKSTKHRIANKIQNSLLRRASE
jgi:hypothetical protein